MYLLGQHSGFVFVFLVVAKLNLDLDSRKLHSSLQRHRMSSIQDGLLGLLIQQVELDRVAVKYSHLNFFPLQFTFHIVGFLPCIHIGIAVEVFPPE